uniref:Uncharacterized protein n=1 Tax=Rhizophora mucronata TaxID=61149 RepID=A0A2P2PCA8_RHIMU
MNVLSVNVEIMMSICYTSYIFYGLANGIKTKKESTYFRMVRFIGALALKET